MKSKLNNDETNILEERADYISDEQIQEWTAETDEFKQLVRKVEIPGAILFEGPRGTGKTHLFRYTYQMCVKNQRKPLPIYVSYGKYYHLEPLLTKKANARKIFHTWVLCNLVFGLEDTIKKMSESDEAPDYWLKSDDLEKIRYFKNNAEKGDYLADESSEKVLREITIDMVISLIKKTIVHFNRTRAILLLDDAALLLTPEYLIEFFDVFRNLKSKNIAPKCTVYPGSTDYGPRFHIGQDARKENIWKADSNGKNDLLQQIAQGRLIEYSSDIPEVILKLVIKASFGVPRALINMINSYREQKGTQQVRFNIAIDNQVKFLLAEYRTLKEKMPVFSKIIEIGEQLFGRIIALVTESNLNLVNSNEKQVYIGFERESIKEMFRERMIRLLIEAGLLFPAGEIKHGRDRSYVRYIPHLAFLIKERAFSQKSKGFNAHEEFKVLERKNVAHPERVSFHKILQTDQLDEIILNLPPCSSCGTKRLSESQNFCHNCGNELINESKFNKCMKILISDIPSVPIYWKNRIVDETNLVTIGDLLSVDQPASELRKTRGIGKKRSEKIFHIVREYVEEFLS